MSRKRSVRGAMTLVAVAGCLLLGVSMVSGQSGTVYFDPAKATFKEVIPGVSAAVVWGNMDKGPYGAFIKFVPGHRDALHTHTNSSHLLVVKAPSAPGHAERRGRRIPFVQRWHALLRRSPPSRASLTTALRMSSRATT